MSTRAWTPADLGSSLLAWYDASDSSTITLTSGAVSQWNDKSVSSGARTGTSYPMKNTTASYRPTVSTSSWLNQGVQTLVLNGSSQYLYLSTAMPVYSDTAGMSAMCAVQRPTDSSTQTIFSTLGGHGPQLRWQADGSALLRNGDVQIVLSPSVAKTPAVSSDFCITGCDIISGTEKLWVRGNQVASASTAPAFTTGISELFGNIGGTELFKGACGEIVITSTVLTTAQRQTLEGYLSWKWGLVSDLPATHPYKTAAPTLQTGTTTTRAWLPTDLTAGALNEWWDASYGVLLNGSNVTNWIGRVRGVNAASNSTNNYATYSNTALNGKHGLTFNGYSTLAIAESSSFPKTDFAVMASGNNTDTGNYQQYICGWGDASNNQGRGFVKASNKLGFDYYGGVYQGSNAPTLTSTAFNAIIGYSVSNSNTVYMYQDGTNYLNTANLTQTAETGNGTFGIAYWPPYGSYWSGIIQQIVVLNRWITDTERQLLEGWESWYTGKNGANLPSSHPYKSTYPTVTTGQATVASGTWTPANLQTPAFAWYDANEQLTITRNSSNQVSVWEDKSLNGRHLFEATTSAMPLYSTLPSNGLPAIYFNNSLMTGNNFDLAGNNVTTFGVLCPVNDGTSSSTGRMIIFSDGSTNSDYTTAGSLLALYCSNGSIGTYANNQYRGNFPGYTANQTNQYISVNAGTTAMLYKDGTAYNQQTGLTNLTTNAPKIVIGGRGESTPTNIVEACNCYISEIIVLNYVPSTQDRVLIEGYLAAKWNLQGYLPSSHPFKSGPQTINTITRPFLPSDLGADVTFWFDASDKTTMTFTDGTQSAVLTWQSKTSAIKLAAPGASNAPGYSSLNGGYALNGAVSNRFMTTTSNLGILPTGYSASTLMFVGKGIGVYNPSLYISGDGTNDRTIGTAGTTNYIGTRATGNDVSTNIQWGSNGNVVVATWDMINPTPQTIWVDGSSASSVTRGSQINSTVSTLGILTNGSGAAGSGDFIQCGICINRLITPLERQRLEGWAAWQYNLVSQLPSSHPFKSAAPTITTIGLATYTGWTPANLAVAPVKWFDAADNSTIIQTSGVVSQWSNKGSEPGHATNTSTGNLPTYSTLGFNGGPAIGFNRSNLLSSPCNFNAPVVWCFAVLYETTDNSHARAVSLNYTGGSSDYDYSVEGNMAIVKSSGDGNWYPGIERNGLQLTNSAAQYWKTPNFVMHGFDGSNGYLFINGATTASNSSARTTNVTATNLNIGGWGSINSGPNDGWTGPISEVILLNYNPTTAEKQQIEGYLAWKWGLQANLPASHPYKSAAPVYSITTYVYTAFTPWDIKSATLQGWYSANDPSTLTTAAGAVTQWRDKSGKGRHLNQSTGAYQPTYVANAENGHPGVVSNGSQFLKTATGMAYPASPLSIFILGTNTAASSANTARLVSLSPSGGTDVSTGGISVNTGGNAVGQIVYSVTGNYSAYCYFPYGPVQIYEAFANSTTQGGAIVNGGFYVGSGSYTTLNPVVQDVMSIFAATNGTTGWVGSIVELLVISGVLSSAEIQKIEGYLAWVNSQPALLPGSHPYKSTLPTLPYVRRRVFTIMS